MITPQIQVLIRIEQEKLELDDKLTKLRAFQRTDIFSKIDAVSQTLLNVQEQIMSAYSQILPVLRDGFIKGAKTIMLRKDF